MRSEAFHFCSSSCLSQEPQKLPGALSVGTVARMESGGTWHPHQRFLRHGIWGSRVANGLATTSAGARDPSPEFLLPRGQEGTPWRHSPTAAGSGPDTSPCRLPALKEALGWGRTGLWNRGEMEWESVCNARAKSQKAVFFWSSVC